MSVHTKQACDACRRRKVRCDGKSPCLRCKQTELACTFLIVPKKKGRRGERANVLSELRAAQKDAAQAQTQAQSSSDIQTPTSTPGSSAQFIQIGHGDGKFRINRPRVRPPVPEFQRTPDLLPLGIIDACTEFFFNRLHSTVPILQRDMLKVEVARMQESIPSYCLILSFCAFVIVQTGAIVGSSSPSSLDINNSTESSGELGNDPDDNNEYGQALLDEALEARKHMDFISARPSCRLIITSFFLYGAHVALGNQRQAWFFLREATTQYMSGPLEVGGGDLEMENSSIFSSQLFWLILVSERGHAIRRHRPVTLQITPETPAFEHQGTEGTTSPSSGLGYLVCLFRPFDETFLGPWNRTHSVCSVASLVNIEDCIQQAVPPNLDISDFQLADLRISQQWLRTMVWQLSITLGFLSSHSEHQCMTFQYPLQIARDLVFSTWKLPLQSMEAHGVGLIEKIFEVACTLTDVLFCLPQTETKAPSGFELGPEDYLKHFISLISKLRGGRTKLLPLLLTRVGQTLPTMVSPISKHLDLHIPIPPATEIGEQGDGRATSSAESSSLMSYDVDNYYQDEDVLGFRNFEMSRTSRSRVMDGSVEQQPEEEIAKVFHHIQIPRIGYDPGVGPLEIQFRP